ncbi:MAG TPA: helix-turn-helix transcriptional regulator [Chitinispirillaceae bacterium]|nr:helix-turn-helix transcriptional regulator [Chitinispirillaceae bacterium]
MGKTLSDIGHKIKVLRQLRGMSQAELAKRLGVSQKIISAYERNYRTPSADKISHLAETLQTTANELYGTFKDDQYGKDLKKVTIWRIVEKLEMLPETAQREILQHVNILLSREKK